MAAENPHDARSWAHRTDRGAGLLRAAHKDIEEQELPTPNLGERAPPPPGRAEDEPNPPSGKQGSDDEIPNFYEKRRDHDPSMQKGIPGPDVTPPDEKDI